MKRIEVNKGQILQRKGDFNSKVYKVESGLLRSYSIDEKGKEYICMFAPENWIMADNCETNNPCELFIDAFDYANGLLTEYLSPQVSNPPEMIFGAIGLFFCIQLVVIYLLFNKNVINHFSQVSS